MAGTRRSWFDTPFRRAVPPAVAGAVVGGALLFGAIALQYTTAGFVGGLVLAAVGGYLASTYLDATATSPAPEPRADECGCRLRTNDRHQVALSDRDVHVGGFSAGLAIAAALAVAVLVVG